MAFLPQTRQANNSRIVGVQPTTPPSDPIPVIDTQLQTPTVVLEGNVTLAAAAAPLAANPTPCKSVTIESPDTNAVVNVGNAATQRYQLQPGATVSLDIDDLNKVYVAGTPGNIVSYIAVN